MTTEGNIEIIRNGGKLSVSVIMPTWSKHDDTCILSVNIPLFGIKTVAKDDQDAFVAIEEAIKCFVISAEKFGNGMEKELQALGWKCIIKDESHTLANYSIESDNVVLEQIMETGEQYAHADLAIA